MDPNIGRVLGDFKILRRISAGGMGIVYEALQIGLNRKVALKLLRPEYTNDKISLERFYREVKVAARLDHPNIVSVYGMGEDRGNYFYAMKYIDGIPLSKLISWLSFQAKKSSPTVAVESIDDSAVTVKEVDGSDAIPEEADSGSTATVKGIDDSAITVEAVDDTGGELVVSSDERSRDIQDRCDCGIEDVPEAARRLLDAFQDKDLWSREVATLFIPVAEALHYAHSEGVIHRDIKPGNLLLDSTGKLMITDFGLAKVTDAEMLKTLTAMGDIIGTPMYMSPEQVTGGVKLDHRTDIYSLGVTLYEFLTFKTPFSVKEKESLYRKILSVEPPSPHKVNPHAPRTLSRIVTKAMCKRPADRYRDMGELANHLRDFSEGKSVKVESVTKGFARRCIRLFMRCKSAAAVVVVCTVVLLISFLAYEYGVTREIHNGLKAMNSFMKEGKYREALNIASYLGAKYPNRHPHVDDALVTAGICYDYLGNKEKSFQTLLGAYRTVKNEESRAKALYYLGNHFSDRSDFHPDFEKACRLYRKVVIRYPNSRFASKARLKLGESLMNIQRVADAKKYLEIAANDELLSDEERQRARDDLRWLEKFFTSIYRLDFSKSRFGEMWSYEVGDIDSDGKNELLVGEEKGLIIAKVKEGVLLPVAHLPLPCCVNNICLGDIDGDSSRELIISQPNPDKNFNCNDVIRAYRVVNMTFREIWHDESGSKILNNAIVTGNPDDDEDDEIVAGMHDYGRDSRLYDRAGKDRYIKIFLNPDLSNSNTHAVAVDDVDDDARDEIVMGTAAFDGYDVRVVKWSPDTGEYDLVWKKKMGDVLALDTGDIDGDGISEIVVSKSFTDKNTAALGVAAPQGEPDGLYIFKFQKNYNDYVCVWKDLIADENCPMPICLDVLASDLDNDGRCEFIALWRIRSEPERRWLDIYEHAPENEALNFRKFRVFYPSEPLFVKAGDIDNDGDTELMVSSGSYLDIYGLNARLNDEFTSIEVKFPPLPEERTGDTPLTVAKDISEMGFFEQAYDACEKIAKGDFPDDTRIAVWNALIDSSIKEGDCDTTMELLEQFERAYPAEATRIAFKKLDVLKRAWRWQDMYLLLEGLSLRKDLSVQQRERIEEALRWVKPLVHPQGRIFSEDFSGRLRGYWKITNPQKFYITPMGLRFHQSRLSDDFARAYIPWRGGSFRLKFNVKVEEVDWNSDVGFGIIKEPANDADRVDFVRIDFCKHGGGNIEKGEGVFHYNMGCEVFAGERIYGISENYSKSFTGGTRYGIEMTYIKQLGEVRTVIRDLNMDEEVVTLSARGKIDFGEGDYYLGNIPYIRNGTISDNWAHFTVDNIEFFNLDPDYTAPENRPSFTSSSQDSLLRANLYLVNGELEQAIAVYSQLIEPGSDLAARAYYFRGLCHKARGDYLSALQDYDRALEIASGMKELAGIYNFWPSLDGMLIKKYFSDDDYKRILDECSKRFGAGEEGTLAKNYFLRGLAYYYRSDYQNALKDFSRAITLEKKNPAYHLHLGYCYLAMKNPENAVQHFDIASQLESDRSDACLHRAMSDYYRGRYTNAIENLTEAIKIKQRFIHFYLRASCYQNIGNLRNYLLDLQRARDMTGYVPLQGYIIRLMVKERLVL